MIGYRYFTECGVVWRRHHGALVPVTMPHALPSVQLAEARKMLVRHRAAFLRREEAFDEVGAGEWWHVIKDGGEDLAALGANTRSKVRRGWKRFRARPEGREAILAEGYDVYTAAFDRYDTFEEHLSASAFREAVAALPEETEFWVVREGGRMVAFSENIVRDGACFYDTIWLDPGALSGYASYVLFHEMNRHYLNERGLRYVSDGARNISHRTGVHEFLERTFGFRRAYARLRVTYFPGLGLVVHLLYPFRAWFAGRSGSLWRKLAVLLEQERIRRSCVRARDDA